MNQNRNKDNDLQRAIDEITQKGGANGGAKPAAAAQPPVGQPPVNMMPPAGMPTGGAMKLPQSPAPQMSMPSMSSAFGRPMGYGSDIS